MADSFTKSGDLGLVYRVVVDNLVDARIGKSINTICVVFLSQINSTNSFVSNLPNESTHFSLDLMRLWNQSGGIIVDITFEVMGAEYMDQLRSQGEVYPNLSDYINGV